MSEPDREITEGAFTLRGCRVLALFGGAHLFGQERANLEVMRTLKTMGAELRAIVDERYAGGEIEKELERLGLSFARSRFSVQWHYALRQPRFLFFNLSALRSMAAVIRREARDWRPTHFYLMNWHYFASGFFAFRSLDLPLIFRAGDLLPDYSRPHRWLTRQLIRRSRSIVCNSEFLARDMTRLGAVKDQLRVIYNHPPVRSEASAEQSPPPAHGTILLFVGQIARHKGIALLVDAVREMIASGADITLWIAGESTWGDPLSKQLRDQVRQANLENRILFFGRRDDVPALLRQCHIHVCPSIVDDPSPNVIVEAKREGIPTIGFPVGGIPELIEHQVDGYLCRDTSREALIDGLHYFIDSADQRNRAGKAAADRSESHFGFARFQRQWGEVFRDTMRHANR